MTDGPDLEKIAMRKVLYRLAGYGEGDTPPDDYDALDAAADAIATIDELEDENRQMRERLEEVERKASNAMGAAKASDNGARADGGPGKKDKARLAARNELVKRCLLDASSSAGGSLTVGEVQTMLRPGTDVAYQTVKDAMNDLASRWQAIYLGENENGTRALKVKRDCLDEDLVGAVEVDLDRDDLTKRLISHRNRGAA
ncbi:MULTISPECIES: hypothetical protein [unclassified Haloferax]|uniref:hypothetical protein n=1 Tax=unclassified Haloferax TaxID=2625095 RepID=UPI002874A46C|nr:MULTISPECIES: hypothetical protein [unclassified Haloferax]MDS0243954.1 hypothetical protein [Haloferax sp. S2CR25]MDS0447075.1 hypothetical protein [Haloferax sp. S2CR25-2]